MKINKLMKASRKTLGRQDNLIKALDKKIWCFFKKARELPWVVSNEQ